MKMNFYTFNGYRVFLAIALFLNFGLSAQTIRYVKQGAGGDGSSWGNPSGSIYGMVEISQPNDEIWVAAGNYTEDFLFMAPEVKVYGGFPASGNPTMAQRNWAAYTTTIFGTPFFYGGSSATTLDGFTVIGNDDGVWVQNSSPALRNLNIKAHSGLRLDTSSSTISNVQITGQNYGMYIYNSTASLINVTVVYNWQYDIYSQASSLTISNSLIGGINDMSQVTSAGSSMIGMSMAGVFVDDGAGNFTPSPYGAAFNTGNTALFPNAATAKDLGGNARVSGSAIDMGAYEYSPPTIRYVKEGGTGDGSSWAMASGDFHQTIFSSTSDDAVWVAAGSYSPGAGESFSMKQGVEIYGGFPNSGNPSMADRNPAMHEVVLTGNGSRVFDNFGLDNTSILDGFTITGGGGVINGAGMQNTNASPLINRCIFRNNTAGDWGGGMYNNMSNPTVTNTLFHHNGGGGGGAAFNDNSNPNFINVTFTENTAGNGGAIHTYNGGNTTVSNCIFWNNNATDNGDQVFSLNSAITSYNSLITNDGDNVGGPFYTAYNVSGDPGFTDPENGDYTIIPCGPAGNIGSIDLLANAATARDLAGNARLDGSNIDAGAYESQQANGTSAPTAPVTQIFEPGATVADLEATGSDIRWYNVPAGGAALADDAQLFSLTYYVSQTIDGCESGRVAVAVTVNYLPVRYVKQDSSGLADGSSWADASNDLQAMINADGVQQVLVAQGEYLTPLDVSFTMKENVAIYGGFPSSGTPGMAERNVRQFETRLVGNGRAVIDNYNNNLTNTALLDGFIIEQGYTGGNGGGISNINAYPTIANCIVRFNYAENWAGGMFNEGSGSAKIINCVFSNNTSSGGGGAFDNLNATPVYTNVTFANNYSYQNGGGLHTYQNAVATLNNCIFAGNTADYDGDQVMSVGDGKVIANYTLIENNSENVYGPFNGTNLISGDPLFTNPGASDYSLMANSPAIDAGSTALFANAASSTELAGNPRLDGTAIDMGAYEFKVSCIYTTVWNGFSWDNGTPVSYEYSAIIEGGYNTYLHGSITACSLTVNSGDVVITDGNNFTIKGAVTVDNDNATLIVHHNANLIQEDDVDNIGTIIVIKESAPMYRLDYALWASPVAGQKLKAFSPQTLDNRFYSYNPLTDAYSAVQAPTTTDFAEGKSYLIRVDNTHPDYVSEATAPTRWTGTFTGVPNNGDVNVAVVPNSAPTQEDANGVKGFNAIGNPYPSSINIAAFFEANASNLANNTPIFFWRKKNEAGTSSYASLTLAGYNANSGNPFGDSSDGVFDDPNNSDNWVINPGQGFIVRATSTTVAFKNGMRTAVNNGQMFRSAMDATDKSRLWLNITNSEGLFGQTTIAYTPNTTLGLDYGWDGSAMTDGSIAIYSLAGESKLGIQARAAFDPADEVPVEYKVTAAGSYSISLDHFDGVFTQGQNIYLRDNVLGVTHNLETPYDFTTEQGTTAGRFDVVYAEALNIDIPAFDSNSIIVYKQSNAINISTGNVDMKAVSIYDIRGRLLYSADNINKAETSISTLQAQEQMLIVQVTTVEGVKASKKIVY